MVLALAAALTLVVLATPGGAPAQMEDCTATLSVLRPDPVSVETVTRLAADVDDGQGIEVDWGDGARSTEPVRGRRDPVAFHQYARPGPVDVVVAALCADGTRGATVRLRLDVLEVCAVRRDASVGAEDCDEARGSLVVSDAGSQAAADWTDPPCRDARTVEIVRPPGDGPTARQADCALYSGRRLVGPLHTRPGAAIRLDFGAPVRRVVLRVGTRTRAVRRLLDAQRVNRTGLAWRARVPRALLPRLRRLSVTAFRPSGPDRYVIDLRLP